MLETIDLDKQISKAAFDKAFRPLRDQLDDLQRAVYEAKVPVAIVLEGWDAAGKGDTIEKMVGRLDPRGYRVHPIFPPTREEQQYPFLHRFWIRTPGRGEIVVYDRSWYHRVLAERVEGDLPRLAWQQAFNEINQFERMLTDDGMCLMKIWLHISEKEQRKRFQKIEKSKYDRWRVTRQDWKSHRRYRDYLEAAEEMLERTNSAFAPWTVVPATDKYYRRVTVFQLMADALREAVARKRQDDVDHKGAKPAEGAGGAKGTKARRVAKGGKVQVSATARSVLDSLDLTRKISDRDYEAELPKLQARLRKLQLKCLNRGRAVIIAYEGSDAAGKGGNIKRVIGALDPRGYVVVPIAAPKGDDATHHYLWRFWTRMPKAGRISIFDRTWYGRVLVERVEGFCTEAEWRRAYAEINQFEQSLVNYGTILVKFWLQITKEEQLKRFKERATTDYKHYKITDEDWRNREKWDAYRTAVGEMITSTSTGSAPWTIVEANDKNWARIKALRTIVDAIEKGLATRPRWQRKGKGWKMGGD